MAPGQKGIKECVDYSFKHNISGYVTKRKLEDFNELVDNMKHDRVIGREVVFRLDARISSYRNVSIFIERPNH